VAAERERDLLDWIRYTREPPDGDEAADVGRVVRHPGIAQVRRELRAVGIRQPFRFVWSDDTSGVDPDDPRTIHILRTLVRGEEAPLGLRAEAERTVSLDVASVARHELGHALLFLRPREARRAGFLRLFGDVSVKYRVGDPIRQVMRRLHLHGGLANPRYRREVSLYAASHPHERFAETVRIVLAHGADETALRRWVEGWGLAPRVLEQLAWAAAWLRRYDEPLWQKPADAIKRPR
jgi:hypothetical protein